MLLQPKIHLYMPKYIVVIFRNFSAQNACAKILLRTQRVSVTWLKIGPCLRSRQKEWELDHYLFSSLWHVYLMFVISILENLKGKKIVFWDVTLTRLVPIWGVLPPRVITKNMQLPFWKPKWYLSGRNCLFRCWTIYRGPKSQRPKFPIWGIKVSSGRSTRTNLPWKFNFQSAF